VGEKEKEMYEHIKRFLIEEKGCDSKTISINQITFERGKHWTMDVAGIRASRIYGVEAKAGCGYGDIIDAITKARFYRYACSYVYVCFPKAEFEHSRLKEFLEEECKQHGIGLLLLRPDGSIEEHIKPQESDVLDLDTYLKVFSQLKMFQPSLSPEVQGARAYIIRDICSFMMRKGYFKESEFIKYVGENEEYWKFQRPGPRTIPLKDLIRNRISWSLRAAEELGLIEKTRHGAWRLTLLGEILAHISADHVKIRSLSKEVKAFFFALAWRYPEVREALMFLKKHGKATWTRSECSKCGNRGSEYFFGYPDEEKRDGVFFIADGRVFCGKCGRILEDRKDTISIKHHVMRVLNRDFYEQLTFWFNSDVFTHQI